MSDLYRPAPALTRLQPANPCWRGSMPLNSALHCLKPNCASGAQERPHDRMLFRLFKPLDMAWFS
jgi:hypothetical protein